MRARTCARPLDNAQLMRARTCARPLYNAQLMRARTGARPVDNAQLMRTRICARPLDNAHLMRARTCARPLDNAQLMRTRTCARPLDNAHLMRARTCARPLEPSTLLGSVANHFSRRFRPKPSRSLVYSFVHLHCSLQPGTHQLLYRNGSKRIVSRVVSNESCHSTTELQHHTAVHYTSSSRYSYK